MTLPENAAAYNSGSGKRNKDLLLQRPLKAMLLAALIGHFKESILVSHALRLLPQPWVTHGRQEQKKTRNTFTSPASPLTHDKAWGALRNKK